MWLASPDAAAVQAAPDARALAQLDGFALGMASAGAFSGVVLVAQDGRVVFERGYGRRDAERDDAVTPETRFNLASAGKMFTAVAVLQQVAAGRLSLDTHVAEVLPDYPARAFADHATVSELLTHTAGAGDIALFGMENADNRTRVRSVADMLALHWMRDPEFPPGSAQRYGNFGHVVLARMVEVLTGEDFDAYLQAHVFEPAGMMRTGSIACADDSPDLAVGYVEIEGQRQRNCATLPVRGFPAGGQVSSARDMLAFVRALQAGRLLPPSLFADAIRPHREFMGLGFFATDYGDDIPARDFRWGHGGSADGICTDIRSYPLTGETVIVLANVDAPHCHAVAGFLHAQWTESPGPVADNR